MSGTTCDCCGMSVAIDDAIELGGRAYACSDSCARRLEEIDAQYKHDDMMEAQGGGW